MILLVLLLLSMFVWLGTDLFVIRNQWYDLFTSTVLELNDIQYPLPIPGMGVVLFVFVGCAIVWLAMFVLQQNARQALIRLHRKEFDVTLPIQFHRPSWVDTMNEQTDSVAAWLAPLLAWVVVIGFLLKYLIGALMIVVARMIPWFAELFESFEQMNTLINQINAYAVVVLAFAVDINGMVTFGFGVIVLFALYLYRQERMFVRDYVVMQHQK